MTYPVIVMPDMQRLAIDCLKADATLATTQMGTRQPGTPLPLQWIKVSRIGGSPKVWQRLDRGYIQVDCYAGTDEQSMTVARRAFAVLFAAIGFTNGEGTITAVEQMQGLQNLPDSSRTPPTPRVIFTVIMYSRPA